MKNRNIVFATILLAFGCFVLLQRVQAVVPTPDGGYGPPSYGPGNTAEGTDALFSLTTGYWNTALGFEALYHDTTGSINTATGVRALFNNTSGTYNAAYGYAALYDNTTGGLNTALGNVALANNIDGDRNTAIGFGALYTNDVGSYNTATGYSALYRNQQSYNTATGYAALYNNTAGIGNTATGYAALYNHDFWGDNTAIGFAALYNGGGSLSGENTAIGSRALYNPCGDENTAIGSRALYNGGGPQGENTAIGSRALYNNTSGSNNIALGHEAGSNVTTASNVIAIGTLGVNASNSCFIGNIWNKPGGSQVVHVNSSGKLGVLVSSARFKEEIKPIDWASEAIHRLRPVSFRYKAEIEPTRPLGFGLIAEEVETINPDLVSRDKDGKPLTVRYEAVNAMLLNEFLKEHKRVQELKATAVNQEASIAEQRKDFEAAISQQRQEIQILTAQLKEQAAQIQKVSVQIEASKFATGQIRVGGPAHPLATNDY